MILVRFITLLNLTNNVKFRIIFWWCVLCNNKVCNWKVFVIDFAFSERQSPCFGVVEVLSCSRNIVL